MAFNKPKFSWSARTGDELTADMISIGMRFGGKASKNAQIENTLAAASIEGLIKKDGRVMALLTDWITVHHTRINVDRLYQILLQLDPKEFKTVLIYWTANAQRLKADPRFKKLEKFYKGSRVNYGKIGDLDTAEYDGTDFLILRNGEDKRFAETCLRVPNLSIRHRLRDVLSPEVLAANHLIYRHRVLLGANIRADLWAALQENPRLSPADLARLCSASYTAAHHAKRDFSLLKEMRKAKKENAA